MTAFEIDNIKQFTSNLFVGNVFDNFYLISAHIKTHSDFNIDGSIVSDYFEDLEEINDSHKKYNRWKNLRPICFEIIKGKKLPSYFKIVMCLDDITTTLLVNQAEGINTNDVDGLYINIKYENGKLSVTTGTSLKIFTLDKALENAFDKYINNNFSHC